jgi:putative heme-binding domain-containing protein
VLSIIVLTSLLQAASDVAPPPPDGGAIFAAKCALCHQVAGRGHAFGPELSDAGLRLTREAILESIAEPSKTITAGYEYVELKLRDGRFEQGVLAPPSAGMILLRQPGGITKRIAKQDVLSTTTLPVSGMTLFLEKLAPADESALVDWLLDQNLPVKRDPVAPPPLESKGGVPRSFVIVGIVSTVVLAGALLRSSRRK